MVIEGKDQVSILVSLFSAFAGISLTVISLILTAYILRRGTTVKKSGMFSSDAVLLTGIFVSTLVTFIISYMAIMEAMEGKLLQNRLFVYSDNYIMVIPSIAILSLHLGIIIICLINTKARKRKNYPGNYIVEITISSILVAASLFTLYIFRDRDSVAATAPLAICFATLAFGMIQIWTTISKDNKN